MKITGFLYGHYDSRGGATFIEAATQEEANPFYLESFACDDVEGMTKAEIEANIVKDDFLGPATLESPTEITHGMDVDYRDDGQKLWVKWKEDANPTDFVYELAVAKEPPPGAWEESELGEDAFGVIVLRQGKSSFEG